MTWELTQCDLLYPFDFKTDVDRDEQFHMVFFYHLTENLIGESEGVVGEVGKGLDRNLVVSSVEWFGFRSIDFVNLISKEKSVPKTIAIDGGLRFSLLILLLPAASHWF